MIDMEKELERAIGIVSMCTDARVECILDSYIAFLRDEEQVIIYNHCAPFVHPKDNKILYVYAAKWCNLRDGWNGRIQITGPIQSYDPIEAKREVIKQALIWLKKKYARNSGSRGNLLP